MFRKESNTSHKLCKCRWPVQIDVFKIVVKLSFGSAFQTPELLRPSLNDATNVECPPKHGDKQSRLEAVNQSDPLVVQKNCYSHCLDKFHRSLVVGGFSDYYRKAALGTLPIRT